MATGDYLFQVLPVRFLIFKRPAAAPGDPDPVELRLLEQAEHLLEIAVVDVAQHVLFCCAELVAPPGVLGLPALDLSAVYPDEAKIPLLRPRRHILRFGAIQSRRWLKMGRAEQQGRGDQTNKYNAFSHSDSLHSFLFWGTAKIPAGHTRWTRQV